MADYINPFNAAASAAIRMVGAGIYMSFMPTADAPFLHAASDNEIFAQSQYLPLQRQFQEAELSRRIRVLEQNAASIGINPEIIHQNKFLFQTLLKADTPAVRAQIREQLGDRTANALLGVFDKLTGNEVGMDRVYAGLANTYGSARGNEMAAWAANYISNSIRQQEPNSLGLRAVDAGSVSGWLATKRKLGYTFEAAAGMNRDDVQSMQEILDQQIAGGSYMQAQEAAFRAYLDDRIAGTSDKTDREILEKIKNSGRGAFASESLFSEYFGDGKSYANFEDLKKNFGLDTLESSSQSYLITNEAGVLRSALEENIKDTTSNLYTEFKNYAKESNISLEKITGDPKKEEERNRQETMLRNKFLHEVQTDMLRTGGPTRYKDSVNTEVQNILDLKNSVETQMGPAKDRAKAEANKIQQEAHLFQTLGQSEWDKLSPEEQNSYLEAAGGKEKLSQAQSLLGADLANKYAHTSMRYQDHTRAALDTHFLVAAQSRADISSADLSKQASFIGSTIQNKGLTQVALNASMAWQAAARDQGVLLTEEDRLEAGQRFARTVDSLEGNTVAMFLSQNFDENSPLGKLQAALMNGTMTPEQEKQFQEYLKNTGVFIGDIAKATGKDRGTLIGEARWARTNWNNLTAEQQANVSGSMYKGVREARNKALVTTTKLDRVFKSLGDKDKSVMGVNELGGDKAFQQMIYDVVQNQGMNVADMVGGLATDEDIKRLEELGLTKAADYARQRKEERDRYMEENKDDPNAAIKANQKFGRQLALKTVSSLLGSEDAAELQGKIEKTDPTKQNKGKSTVQNVGEQTQTNINKGGTKKSAADMTPEEIVAGDKDAKGIREAIDPYVKPLEDAISGGVDILGLIYKLLTDSFKRKGGEQKKDDSGSDENTSQKVQDALVAAVDDKEFKSKVQKALIKLLEA